MRASAQVQAMLDTDWDFLIDTAVLHHAMWSEQRWNLAAEIRLRLAKFGVTPEDRARLRMQIETAPQETKRTEPVASKAAKKLRTKLRVIDGEAS